MEKKLNFFSSRYLRGNVSLNECDGIFITKWRISNATVAVKGAQEG